MREGFDQPGFADLGAGVRAEWRDEQEAAAADAATVWRRSRTLGEWLVDRMHCGDRLSMTVGPVRFSGAVEEVGPDLLGLRTDEGRVDVGLSTPLPLAFSVTDRPGRGGRRARAARTFRDALSARDGSELRVGSLVAPEGTSGLVRIARDFAIVGEGAAETIVPLVQVAWIAPAAPEF